MGVNKSSRNLMNTRITTAGDRGTPLRRDLTPLRRHHYVPQMILRRITRHNRFLDVRAVSDGRHLGFVKPDNIAYSVGDIRDRNIEQIEKWFSLTESRFSNFLDLVSSAPFEHTPKERDQDVRNFVASVITRNPYQEFWGKVDPYKWLPLKVKKSSIRKQTRVLSAVLRDRCDMRFLKAARGLYWSCGDVPWTIWHNTLVFPLSKNLALQIGRKKDKGVTSETLRLNKIETQQLAGKFLESGVNEFYIPVSQKQYESNKNGRGHFIGETYVNPEEAKWETYYYRQELKKERIQEREFLRNYLEVEEL